MNKKQGAVLEKNIWGPGPPKFSLPSPFPYPFPFPSPCPLNFPSHPFRIGGQGGEGRDREKGKGREGQRGR